MATTTSATTTTTTATSTPVTTAMATTTSATTTMTSLATTINIVSVSCFTELDDLNVISLTVSCPPLCGDICLVYGTDVYTSDSCICGAATHAGKISAFGGYVTFKRKTSAAQYLGSFRNGIFSFDTYYAAYSLVFI
ncbi:vitrin-like [Discoglossus pictus]